MNVTTKTTQDNVAAHTSQELKTWIKAQTTFGKHVNVPNHPEAITFGQINSARKNELVEWAWELVQEVQVEMKADQAQAAAAKAEDLTNEWTNTQLAVAIEGLVVGMDKEVRSIEKRLEEHYEKLTSAKDEEKSNLERLREALYVMEWSYTKVKAGMLKYREAKNMLAFLRRQSETKDRTRLEIEEVLTNQQESVMYRLMNYNINTNTGIREDEGKAELEALQFQCKMLRTVLSTLRGALDMQQSDDNVLLATAFLNIM